MQGMFHQNQNSQKRLIKIIQQSRCSGRLNLSNFGMNVLPDIIWNPDTQGEVDVRMDRGGSMAWWDVVDLVCIIAANNELKEVDSRVSEFGNLAMIDFHHNQIRTLNNIDFTAFQSLTYINFSYNELTSLPASLYELPLVELNLQNNKLVTISTEIGQLKRLKVLQLSHNQLENLPANLASLTLLSTLNLSNNKILDLNNLLLDNKFLQLSDLDLSSNRIEELIHISPFAYKVEKDEPIVIDLPALTRLDLKFNKLECFPECGIQWPLLKDLCLAGNKLKSLHSLPIGLEILDIKDNQLNVVPEGLWEVTSLKRLDLSNNNIKVLEPRLGLLTNLQILLYVGNPIRGMVQGPASKLLKQLRDRISENTPSKEEQLKKSMEQLHIEKKGLNGYEQISGQLDLTFKQLNEQNVDSRVQVDFHPSTVRLDKNEFTKAPCSWLQINFAGLTCLSLNQNRILDFPQDITLPQLRSLHLSRNKISSLPRSFNANQFPKLMELDLSMNRLTELTFDDTFPFPVLQTLFLNDNKIISIDVKSFYQGAKSLQTLDLRNNNISNVPPELGRLTWLKALLLNGNCFKMPRGAILDKGTEAVLSYLRDRIPQ